MEEGCGLEVYQMRSHMYIIRSITKNTQCCVFVYEILMAYGKGLKRSSLIIKGKETNLEFLRVAVHV
jgi:hypothetical protein